MVYYRMLGVVSCVIWSRTLFIQPVYTSLHLLILNFESIAPLLSSPLAVSLFLLLR